MTSDRQDADETKTSWLVTKRVRLAFLLLASAVISHSQDSGRLYTFFKQNIGLNDSEIVRIEEGKTVARMLDSPTPSQFLVFGAVFIMAQPSAYLQLPFVMRTAVGCTVALLPKMSQTVFLHLKSDSTVLLNRE